MAVINTEDIWLLGLVSLIAAQRLAHYAQQVGNMRFHYKIDPPAVDGPEEFIRTFRAQQNALEFMPIFMVCLWVSGIFFHQIPAAIVGLVYVYAREHYFNGYCKAAKFRKPGFYWSVRCLYVFMVMSIVGLIYTGLWPLFR